MDKTKIPASLQSFPSPFVRVITQTYYDAGDSDYTVTTLLGPPRRTMFKKQGHSEINRSVYAGMVAMWGTAMHWILEQGARKEEGEFTEVRNFVTLNVDGDDVKVSGCMDLWENGRVWDYKFIKGDQDKMKVEHHDQLQFNAWLAEQNEWKVDGIGVCYTDKTWSPGQADQNPMYPQMPCKVFLSPYDKEWAQKHLMQRLTDHHRAVKGDPRDCTPTEQWAAPDIWALKKPDAGRARKLCASAAEADQEKKPGEIVQFRAGVKKYCQSWCGYKHLCPQYKREQLNQSQEEP